MTIYQGIIEGGSIQKSSPPTHLLIIRKMWQLRFGVVGSIIIFGLFLIALFTPIFAPHDPYEQNVAKRLLPPSWMEGSDKAYILGTDRLGRDLLSRVMYGTRVSMTIGISAVILQIMIGVALGLIAGFFGGKADSIITFFINVMMCFPYILLIMTLVLALGPSLPNIIVALALTGWPVFARVSRIETIKLRDQEFVLAATSLGFKVTRILFVHILPNILPSILVLGTVAVAQAIIQESLLSFLGLGIQPPTASWGLMLSEGREYMLTHWWQAAFPGFAIFLAALGINFTGDALRDLLDPHLRKS